MTLSKDWHTGFGGLQKNHSGPVPPFDLLPCQRVPEMHQGVIEELMKEEI